MHSPQQYSYIYFPELASLQTLKLHHVTLTTFYPVYTDSPQQYSYIYTFLNWQAFKHWNFIMSHLQHFTQCIHIPHSSTHNIYTFLNWQAFKHWNFIMSHLQHFTQCIQIPHSSTHTYIYFPELASLQTLKLYHVTLTTFYPSVYTFPTAVLIHIYFPELASLQTHWNFIMSHLQHFTQCIQIPHSSTHTYILSWTGKPSNTETSSCHTYNIFTQCIQIPHSSTHTYTTFLNWQAFKHWNFIMSHLQHFTQCIQIPHSSTHTYILSWTGKPSNTETSSCHTYNILPSVYTFPTAVLIRYILSWTGKPSNTETSSCHTYNILPSVYRFPTAVLIHIYFPELASLQTLKLYHVTLTTFYPVYTHSPQQYSYIYTFLNWQAFKHWNFIMSHLQHFTQCIQIPPQQYSYLYTFLNWQAFKHWNFIMSHLQHFTQCIQIPHSSTHTYILSWTGKPSNTETSSCHTYNILPSVYTFPTAVLIHIYFPELTSLQTLKLYHVTLTTFYPVYKHSPQQYSYIYTFLNWQAFKHWKFIVSHLQHFTQCIYAFPTPL